MWCFIGFFGVLWHHLCSLMSFLLLSTFACVGYVNLLSSEPWCRCLCLLPILLQSLEFLPLFLQSTLAFWNQVGLWLLPCSRALLLLVLVSPSEPWSGNPYLLLKQPSSLELLGLFLLLWCFGKWLVCDLYLLGCSFFLCC